MPLQTLHELNLLSTSISELINREEYNSTDLDKLLTKKFNGVTNLSFYPVQKISIDENFVKTDKKKFLTKGANSLNKLSLFQKNDGKFSKKCPLSIKNAPIIDYKNISLLKKYISDNGKIILKSKSIEQIPIHLRAKEGLGYLPHKPSIFRGLNVENNIMAILETTNLNLDQRVNRPVSYTHLTLPTNREV